MFMLKHLLSHPLVLLLTLSACQSDNAQSDTPAGQTPDVLYASEAKATTPTTTSKALGFPVKLHKGFEINVYHDDVPAARSLKVAPDGTVFVSTRKSDKVYALRDTDKDGRADEKYTIASGMDTPNGIAFKDGDLYIAEISRISVIRNVLSQLDNPPAPELLYDGLPTDAHHGWKFIAFGPDGYLYVPVGAPCNICNPEDSVFASILRMNPDGSERMVYAHGVRNTVGFDWHPQTRELWFTDNGRDWMGDDEPPCELNYAPEPGMHFGYPFCHGADVKDPEFGEGKDCADYTKPVVAMYAHTAPLGMRFYTGSSFPEKYQNAVFVAQHGSWNRSTPIGYRVMVAYLDENGHATGWEPFVEGFLDGREKLGRPVDVCVLEDGSLLISDDMSGKVYRVSYTG
ncbi:MAG: PQQ-dependent sugar dehydrogenase [Bacteroidota bacterium]